VKVANVAIEVLDRLAFEFEDNAEHPVRAGMLRPHVDDEFLGPRHRADALYPGRRIHSDHQNFSRIDSTAQLTQLLNLNSAAPGHSNLKRDRWR
jgi:hypothetical protein